MESSYPQILVDGIPTDVLMPVQESISTICQMGLHTFCAVYNRCDCECHQEVLPNG